MLTNNRRRGNLTFEGLPSWDPKDKYGRSVSRVLDTRELCTVYFVYRQFGQTVVTEVTRDRTYCTDCGTSEGSVHEQ